MPNESENQRDAEFAANLVTSLVTPLEVQALLAAHAEREAAANQLKAEEDTIKEIEEKLPAYLKEQLQRVKRRLPLGPVTAAEEPPAAPMSSPPSPAPGPIPDFPAEEEEKPARQRPADYEGPRRADAQGKAIPLHQIRGAKNHKGRRLMHAASHLVSKKHRFIWLAGLTTGGAGATGFFLTWLT